MSFLAINSTDDAEHAARRFLHERGLVMSRALVIDRYRRDLTGPGYVARVVGPGAIAQAEDVAAVCDRVGAATRRILMCVSGGVDLGGVSDGRRVELYEIDESGLFFARSSAATEAEESHPFSFESSLDDSIDDLPIGFTDEERASMRERDEAASEELGAWVALATWVSADAYSAADFQYGRGTLVHEQLLGGAAVFNLADGGSEMLRTDAEPLTITEDTLVAADGVVEEHRCGLIGLDLFGGGELWRVSTSPFVSVNHKIRSVTKGSTLLVPFLDQGNTFAVGAFDIRSGHRKWWRETSQICALSTHRSVGLVVELRGDTLWSHFLDAETGDDIAEWALPFVPSSCSFDADSMLLWSLAAEVNADGIRELTALDAASGEVIDRVSVADRQFHGQKKVLHAATAKGLLRRVDGVSTEYAAGFRPRLFSEEVVVARSQYGLGVWDTETGARLFEVGLADLSGDAGDTWIAEDESTISDGGDVILQVARRLVVLAASNGEIRQNIDLPTVGPNLMGVVSARSSRWAILRSGAVAAAVPIVAPSRSEIDETLSLLDGVTASLEAGTVPLGLASGEARSDDP